MSGKNKKKYTSLRTKLYVLISVIIVLAIGVLTWRNITSSKSLLEAQMSQRSLNMSEMSLKSLEGQMVIWKNQGIQILKFLDNKNTDKAGFFANGLLETNESLVSIDIIAADNLGAGSKDKNYKNPSFHIFKSKNSSSEEDEETKKSIHEFNLKWIDKYPKKDKLFASYLTSFGKSKGQKYYGMMIPATSNANEIIWACLTIETSNLSQYLSKEDQTYAFILEEKGKFLFTADKVFGQLPIFKTAISGQVEIGSKNFKGEDHIPYLASYAWSDQFRFAVVYIKDIRETSQSIELELIKTGILTLIILFIAVLVAYFAAVSLTSKLGKLTGITTKIAKGDFSQRIKLNSNDEIGFLEDSINHMAGEIHRLLSTSVDAAKKEKELLTAKAVQDTFFHKDSIRSDNIFTVGHYVSADECGGDWWGHFSLNSETDMVCIADATGHGAPAALVTAIAYSFFQTFMQIFNNQENPETKDPGKLLYKLNKVFWEAGRGKTTMTFFLGFLDKKNGKLIYANAGHNVPMIFPRDENDKRLKKKKPGSLHGRYFQVAGQGIPLGYQDGSEFETKSIDLISGDKLFLYTDGLIECKNRKGEMWSKTKLIKSLSELVDRDIEFILKDIIKQAFHFFDSQPTDDDITVVMVEYS